MKHNPSRRRVQVLLPIDLHKLLVKTCAASGDTLTRYIARAIYDRLEGTSDRKLLFQRLDRHTSAQQQTQHDLELLQEALGMFVQFWFAHTPPVTKEHKAKAWQDGERRYKQFAAFVAKKFRDGHRFADDLPQEEPDDEPGSADEPAAKISDSPTPEPESKK